MTDGQTSIIVCPSKLVFHIPCPGCGVTRATLLFLHGHIKEAFFFNPNVVFAIAFLVFFPIGIVTDIVWRKGILVETYRRIDAILQNKWVFGIFMALELCIWIHNIICGI